MEMKIILKNVDVRGWVQNSMDGTDEIVVLEIKAGEAETRVRVDMSGDEMVSWCEEHKHNCIDVRKFKFN